MRDEIKPISGERAPVQTGRKLWETPAVEFLSAFEAQNATFNDDDGGGGTS